MYAMCSAKKWREEEKNTQSTNSIYLDREHFVPAHLHSEREKENIHHVPKRRSNAQKSTKVLKREPNQKERYKWDSTASNFMKWNATETDTFDKEYPG